MPNHSTRNMWQQDVVCTAIACERDIAPQFYPALMCQYHCEMLFKNFRANLTAAKEIHDRPEVERQAAASVARRAAINEQAVVYYVEVAQGIKIGTTTNMRRRMNELCVPDSAILATEPGGYRLETLRHRFFADTRIPRSEVFRDSPKLRKHIEAVIKYHGAPRITTAVPV